jgi:hypothetical protein
MVNYTRFHRKTSTEERIEWIEVLSLDQLEPLKFFNNKINSEVYYAQPEIVEHCNKNLSNPLSSFHAFMKIILQSIIPNTSEYLRELNQKRTCYDEIVELIMVSMAVTICAGKFDHFQHSVSNLRQFLKTKYGISPKWPGKDRLQVLRSCLRAYGEHENELLPGKMARKVENIVTGQD